MTMRRVREYAFNQHDLGRFFRKTVVTVWLTIIRKLVTSMITLLMERALANFRQPMTPGWWEMKQILLLPNHGVVQWQCCVVSAIALSTLPARLDC